MLVVDDDQAVCEVVELVLADEGYAVRSAGDAGSALGLLQERAAAIILLDLTLPGDGSEAFVTAYRRLPHGTAPIVLMSGRADIQAQVVALEAAGSVGKPFDIDVLVDTVRTVLAAPSAPPGEQASAAGESESAGPTCVRTGAA